MLGTSSIRYLYLEGLFIFIFFSFRMRISMTFDNSLTKRILCACHNQKPHTQRAYIAHSVHSRTDIFWMFHFFLSCFFIIQSKLILRIVSSFLFRCVYSVFYACQIHLELVEGTLGPSLFSSVALTHTDMHIYVGSYMKFQEAF